MTTPLDADACWDEVHLLDPDEVYLVATTPRTGSTLLCEALRDTHRLGVPFEYFNPETMRRFAARIGVPRPRPRARLAQLRRRMHHHPASRRPTSWLTEGSVRSYVRWLTTHRTSATGSFASKVHRDELDHLTTGAGVDVFELLRPRRVVWLRRADSTRQAISLYRARATSVWHSTDGPVGRPDPPFDAEGLRATIAEVEADDARWAQELASRALPVHQITYEELVVDQEAVLAECFTFLGAPGTPVPASRLERVADEVTEEWVERLAAAR
jgi:LPS sulfotransferase NodH